MQRGPGKRVAGRMPSGRQKKKKSSRLTPQQKVLLVIVALLAVGLMAVLVYRALFVRPDLESKKDKDAEQGGITAEIDYGEGVRPKADGERKSEDYYTVLILGRDTGGGGNTDTMLLASYDVTNQKATVMSIPRDTMVNVSWDVKKINSVYNANGGGDKGIQALYKEIAQLVGFEPDFQVVVEWEAVGKLVDAIGGVYFDVPYQMDYHDEWQDLVIEQDKGYRLLTGDDAMQVIRWRKNDKDSPYGHIEIGDSGRMQLQQSFLKAIIEQLMKPSNVMNISKIAKVFEESVETNLSFQEILWFGKAAVSGGLSVGNVEFITMPWKDASVYSRTYSKQLGRYTELLYVVPVSGELMDIINNKLSPFVEPFKLSNLDIMYVNADGSIGSTTGYVEDSRAALPPEKPNTTVPDEHEGEGEPVEPDVPPTTEPEPDPETGETGMEEPESEGPVDTPPEISEPGTAEAEPEEPPVNGGGGPEDPDLEFTEPFPAA